MKEIKLKVAESIQDDVNKGIVRVDSSFMHEISIRSGDIIEIKGERSTVGIVDRAYPGDIGLNIIRMDGLIRRNAKAGIGELVSIKKADIKEAKKVIIAPQRKGIIIRANPVVFKQGLLGRAVIKGDIVSLGGARRRKTAMSQNPMFPDELFESLMGFGMGDLKFVVVDADPDSTVIISENTKVEFNPEGGEVKDEKVLEVTYEDIGGLSEEIKKIREMVELPLKHPEIFEALGIEPPKGVLLHGPPGTGKTLLAKAVANETDSNFILINGPEIMSKYYGQSEENLRKKFEDAQKNAPSIIFIDEIDAIASKREESKGEVERRVVAQLLAIMDGLKNRGKVVVIGATNIPNELDGALRRPGRFDREIEIGVPRIEGRMKILKIHTRNMPLKVPNDISFLRKQINNSITNLETLKNKKEKLMEKSEAKEKYEEEIKELENKKKNYSDLKEKIKNINTNQELTQYLESKDIESGLKNMINQLSKDAMLEEISEITHGFVGADLSALAKEAAMIRLRKIMPDMMLEEDEVIPTEILEKLKIENSDFIDALKVVRPSSMREVLIDVPNVKWTDVGGLEDTKQELKEAVEWPLKMPESFKRLGVTPPKGILLYGAPGTGKTMLAKAVATESGANFIQIKGPELLSKWVGESEKAVRKVFEKARQASPAIIFFDEIDSLAPRRGQSSDGNTSERVVNQLLTEMDGLVELHNIVILAATNRPDIVDTALLRPGRFDRIIHVISPEEKARELIFKAHTKNMPLDKNVDIKELSTKTEGYVGADIEAVCREAAILALREDRNIKKIEMKYFESALKKIGPSSTKEIEKAYASLQNKFRSAHGKDMKENKPLYYG
ncbi:CDC48 family AAA ATPase [archaeon]|jgi:transitional endoplasmic reticulum ATPase|nr:CDC48 family AAA ATPase [archaeon]